MNSDRIKEIQKTTAYPDSRSVTNALLQVWNECAQEINLEKKELATDAMFAVNDFMKRHIKKTRFLRKKESMQKINLQARITA